MIPPIPQLITPAQELHGPSPLNVPGWDFAKDELAKAGLGVGDMLSIKPNPNLLRRRLFAYFFVLFGGTGTDWAPSTIAVKYKQTSILEIPFGFGQSDLAPNGQSDGSLLGFGTVPTSGALKLNLSTPLIAGETNPVFLYPFEIQGPVDQVIWSMGKTTQPVIFGRIWLGCISQ